MSGPPEPKRPPVVDTTKAEEEQAKVVLSRKGKGYASTMVAGAAGQGMFGNVAGGGATTMGQNTKLGAV